MNNNEIIDKYEVNVDDIECLPNLYDFCIHEQNRIHKQKLEFVGLLKRLCYDKQPELSDCVDAMINEILYDNYQNYMGIMDAIAEILQEFGDDDL